MVERATRLAVFDFDGTCLEGQSGLYFAEYLFRHGLMTLPRALRLSWWGFRYVLHLPQREEEAREALFSGLEGLDVVEVTGLMRRFHDEVLVRKYRPEAVREIQRRRAEGCVTLLVSATFLGIAQAACDYLGADVLIATEMEKDRRGLFTGQVLGPVIQGREKPRSVARWADAHVGEGGWRISYAYGDRYTDQYLLAQADVPTAVCPDRGLRTVACRLGWRVVDWSI